MDPDGSIVYYWIALVVLILMHAFFSASEASLINLNDPMLKRMADDGDAKAKKILRLIGKPQRFLATIQTGITITGMLAVALVADPFATRIYYAMGATGELHIHRIWLVVIITLLLSFLVIVAGKLLPRRLSAFFPEQIGFAVIGPMCFVSKLMSPLVSLLSATSNLLVRLTGKNPNQDLGEITEEEIRMMVDVGEEKGTIEQAEKDMINNIFEFDDRSVGEIMTHRMEVTAIEADEPMENILSMVKESGYSRIPVYDDDLDNILGILYVKDLLGLVGTDMKDFDIRTLLREPFYVPESTRCTQLFREFKRQKLHMAVVVDEYGGTYGLVTMEDLLESIVGNIQDEYDNEVEEIQKVSDTVYTFEGWTSVDEVERALNIGIPDDSEYETLGGVLVDLLGDLPKKGEHPSVSIGNVNFTILEVDDRRITRVKAEILPAEEENEK